MNNITEIYRSKAHKDYCEALLARRAMEQAMRIADGLIEMEKSFDAMLERSRIAARNEDSLKDLPGDKA